MKISRKLSKVMLAVAMLVSSKMFCVKFGLFSHHIMFTGASVLGPLLGVVLGIPGLLVCSLLSPLLTISMKGAGLMQGAGVFMTFGIPTMASGLCFYAAFQAKRFKGVLDVFVRLIIPSACMILFVAHDVGYLSFPYALYWFIPMVLFVVDKIRGAGNYFFVALGSTFVAHALGSVIYLYTFPTAPINWLSLIPVVAFERFMFAGVMTMTLLVYNKLVKKAGCKKKLHCFFKLS